MWAWVLSKLFSIETLSEALSKKPDVVSCNVILHKEMANAFNDMYEAFLLKATEKKHEHIH